MQNLRKILKIIWTTGANFAKFVRKKLQISQYYSKVKNLQNIVNIDQNLQNYVTIQKVLQNFVTLGQNFENYLKLKQIL